jgi:hypothetical protein
VEDAVQRVAPLSRQRDQRPLDLLTACRYTGPTRTSATVNDQAGVIVGDSSNSTISWVACRTPRFVNPHLSTGFVHVLLVGVASLWLGGVDRRRCSHPGEVTRWQ